MTRESKYQVHVISRLRDEFPGCFIMKNDSSYQQGVPDLTIFFGPRWAVLEIKAHEHSRRGPNQEWHVAHLNEMGFAAFIYPENEEEVFRALQHTFES